MAQTLPKREDVPVEMRWNVESVFPNDAAWEAEFDRVDAELANFAQYQGKLGSDAKTLLDALKLSEKVMVDAGRLGVYASMQHNTDFTNQKYAGYSSRMGGLSARINGAASFYVPEILAIPSDRLEQFIQAEPDLAIFRHYFEALERKRPHVRSAEVEKVISQASDSLNTHFTTGTTLINGDLKFRQITNENSEQVEVAQGNINTLVRSPRREVRRAAWEAYADGYLGVKNTLASSYSGAVKRDVFHANVHNYPSSLESALGANYIPTSVFHNLIAIFRANLPTWHRYWAIRKRLFGGELHTYDLPTYIGPAPIGELSRTISYREGVDLISEGLQPLGDEYLVPARRGLLEQRWVDVLPNQGKAGMAYSSGSYSTYPFIFMNYNDTLLSVSTLAHELGHSMHSYFTRHTQPPIYGSYSIFVAEVASNFNQALLRAHLLRESNDRDLKIAVIEEAMFNFHRYLYVMLMLARFELDSHERIERGEALTADSMSAKIVELFREGYGDEVEIDEQRLGITWAQFMQPHLFYNFYVYQYATGISAANALAHGVLEQGEPAVKRYLDFLKAGSSLFPLDALKLAGIDMTSPEPIERGFAILADYVDQLDKLV